MLDTKSGSRPENRGAKAPFGPPRPAQPGAPSPAPSAPAAAAPQAKSGWAKPEWAKAWTARWVTTDAEREDLGFVGDAEAALYDAPPRGTLVFVLSLFALVVVFLGWAYFAELEEVTRGEGRVIPSSKTQVVQSLEGGIVEKILVSEGDAVRKGQILLQIDDTGFASDLGELDAKALSLAAQTARLRIEAAGKDVDELVLPPSLIDRAPQVAANERNLFEIRKASLENQLNVLRDRLEQKRLELAELHETRKQLENGLEIAKKEQSIKAPLAERGIVPKTDMLRLDREVSDLEGKLATTSKSIPRAEAAISEAERLLKEQRLTFRQTAQAELNTKLAELAVVEKSILAAKDRVRRTEVRSPVEGVVNKLHVNTIGGVMQAGEPMIEITPVEDNLLVEVRVNPKDIAFISPGQKALVKLTAYDFTVYGGLDGEVEIISSDSIYDEATKESYYLVTVRTKQSSLRRGEELLPIIPGMVASVDIITGKKSVLDYLLKPIIKARQEALRER